ncbi:MAG TPA: CHASE3 domain-containing protein [Gemmatimonadaceae bacterium]|jgi:signal transduction histidine kinase
MGSLPTPKLTKRHRIVATYGGAAIIVMIGVLTYLARRQANKSRQGVDHTYAVLQATSRTRSDMQEAETGQRGFLLTGDESYLTPYHNALTALRTDSMELRELTRDNPVQQYRLDTLSFLIEERLAALAQGIDLRRTQGAGAAAGSLHNDEGQRLMNEIRRFLTAIDADERVLLNHRTLTVERWRDSLTWGTMFGTLASALVAVFINMLLTRFAASQEDAARVLATQNTQLQEQGLELELQHQQLQDQATELEMQNEQLQQQAVELETQTEHLQQQTLALEAQTEAAERAQYAAEIANAAKTEFLAAMSHELRTPLNAIAGYADLLSMGVRGPVSESQLQDLSRIKKSSLHLLSLINEILNLARIEAGRVDVHMTDVSAQAMLEDVAGLVVPQMQSKSLTCTVDPCDPSLGIHTDSEKARQILLNLLTNAYKFTDRGGRVNISCSSTSTLGQDGMTPVRQVSIRVTDSGRGIPADKLVAIFEPFVQIDRRQTPEPDQGLGLGLAISRDLARTMGGDLTVESTPGKGSTFILNLPASAPNAVMTDPGPLLSQDRVVDAIS